MATTMVAAAIWEDSLTIANVGDSRAYLIRNDAVQQLTRDHNLASELVRDGVITEEEAQNSPVKSRITRSLGGELDVFVDVFPDIPLRTGDRLLLCSDGLTRYARPDDLLRLAGEGTPEEAVQCMVNYANEAGGIDNTTVILLEIGENVEQSMDLSATLVPGTGTTQNRDSSTADTLPGMTLAALSLQETTRTSVPPPDSGIVPEGDVAGSRTSWKAVTTDSDLTSLADTLRTKPAPFSTTAVMGSAGTSNTVSTATPSRLVSIRSPAPGRRLQPHRPFGKYTPSLILILGFIWLIGMLAVGGWFMYSRLRGSGAEAKATSTPGIPAVAPLPSNMPTQPSMAVTIQPEPGTAILPSASTALTPTLSIDLTTTPLVNNQGRTYCQIAVQPGENLSIITTKLTIALQIDAFKCAAGENGGCEYDAQQPDALRDGWVMVFPDVERQVCEQYNGSPLETSP
jgi:hypothetical protein